MELNHDANRSSLVYPKIVHWGSNLGAFVISILIFYKWKTVRLTCSLPVSALRTLLSTPIRYCRIR